MHKPDLQWTTWELLDSGDSYILPYGPGDERTVTIKASFRNVGDAPAALFTVSLALDGNVLQTTDFSNVPPGAELRFGPFSGIEVKVDTPGDHVIELLLDSRNDLNDSNPGNNLLRLPFSKKFPARDGGRFGFSEALIRFFVEPGAVAANMVEFVMSTPPWMTWRKEAMIAESPQTGTAVSTIATDGPIHTARTTLTVQQLPGAFIDIRKAGFLGQMTGVGRLQLTHALPGSRVRIIWMNDGTHPDPKMLGPTSWKTLLTSGGGFDSGAGTVVVSVAQGAVPPGEVEFVLTSPGTWHKEIQIGESPAAGTGVWPIITQDHKHEDRNGLYAYQLPGAYLFLRASKMFGVVTDLCLIDASNAAPGSRITFTWTG